MRIPPSVFRSRAREMRHPVNYRLIVRLALPLLPAAILLTGCPARDRANDPRVSPLSESAAYVPPADASAHASQTHPAPAAISAGSIPHWSYEGEAGPARWGELSEACSACAAGLEQSPINLAGATSKDLDNPVFSYGSTRVNTINNGHTIQVNADAGSAMELDGKRYELLQFHFHAPSEHAVDGERFSAEMHLVHRSEAGEYAVVGVLIREGKANPAYSHVLEYLPAEGEPEREIVEQVEPASLLPESRTTWRYDGSLTTPPCTEGVHWVIMTGPVELSAAQLAPLIDKLGGNSRPVQPLNARTLLVDTSP